MVLDAPISMTMSNRILHCHIANLVLQNTIERIFVKDVYADIDRGIFLVRGENVLLLGEIVRGTPKSAIVALIIHFSGS